MKFKTVNSIQPYKLVDMTCPQAVLEEVKYNFVQSYPIKDFDIVRRLFKDFVDLYEGNYSGYRSCNMVYHDIHHSTDVLLVFSRIVDGYNIAKPNNKLPIKKVIMGIAAVLFHDSGYIQKYNDLKGTGAKYTQNHEKRSVDFIRGYFKKTGFTRVQFDMAKHMIECTDFKIAVDKIDFKTKSEKLLGSIVGTADLVGQMAERAYLEKLELLYEEFKEAGIMTFQSEYDMLRETINFYKGLAKIRIDKDFGGVFKYLKTHFNERYRIDSNLYIDAIERQLNYLNEILENEDSQTYKERLRRKG